MQYVSEQNGPKINWYGSLRITTATLKEISDMEGLQNIEIWRQKYVANEIKERKGSCQD